MRFRSPASLFAPLLFTFVLACGSSPDELLEPEIGPYALYELEITDEDSFFDLPFPNDLRRSESGSLVLDHFPNPTKVPLLDRYIMAASELKGFGTTTPVYFRFEAPVDTRTLPASVEEALSEDSSAFLVDIDPLSPERGKRHPVEVFYQPSGTEYWRANTVAIRPVHGRPLAWGRRYAAVILRSVKPEEGEGYKRGPALSALMEGNAEGVRAEVNALYKQAASDLEEFGIRTEMILSMSVFTTQDDFLLLEAARDHLLKTLPEPDWIGEPRALGHYGNLNVVDGFYPSPIYQHGTLPYPVEGGHFVFDEAGHPALVREFEQRVSFSIPTSEMPAAGYPLVLYAHGTGGSYLSYVNDGTAASLAARGIAMMGIDQIHHGPRLPPEAGQEPELFVYNILNPHAFRYNALQAALDVVQQARFAVRAEIDGELIGRPDERIVFDTNKIYFMGHSQGGQNGPLFLAIDDTARGAMLSGAGGQLTIALIEKTEPLNIPEIVGLVLNLPGSTTEEQLALENVSAEHPVLNLLQMWIEIGDPVNYAHRFFLAPRKGHEKIPIFQTEGVDDSYTPPASIEALAVAAGIPLLKPVIVPLEEYERVGISSVCPPVSMNANGVTAGLSQYDSETVGASDGHFVTRREPAATQVAHFFETLAAGAAEIPIGHPCD